MTALPGLHSIDDLLAVEDDPALLEYRCPATGLLIWPLIRVTFLREILGDALYSGSRAASMSKSPKAVVSAVARATWHDISQPPGRADVLIMASGVGHQLRHGVSYNRLADPFVDVAPERTILVEDLFNWHWPFPRHRSRVAFHTPLQAAAAAAGRVLARRRHRELAEGLIALVSRRAADRLDWTPGAERRHTLVTTLTRKVAALPLLQRGYRLLLERVRPRILLREEACYGASAMLLSVARDMGITTAEYQHGVVASGHDAYNFAPALRASTAWREILPDWFLGYGSWWNSQINAPVQKRAIGNPHRSLQLEAMTYASTSRPEREVLVLGDGIETDAYVALCRAIATALPDWSVTFRPHPLERKDIAARFPAGLVLDDGRAIPIDQEPDIYASFRRTTVVVSEMSTGLFEAIGLVPSVLLWDTPKSRFTFREHPFRSFTDVEHCVTLLREGRVGELRPAETDAIWAPDWRANYMAFLEESSTHQAGAQPAPLPLAAP